MDTGRALVDDEEMTAHKPYPSYRQTDLPWLGQIPVHWEVKPLKYEVILNPEVLTETTDPNYEIQYLDIGNVDEIEGIGDIQEFRFENAPSRARRKVRAGDTIISTVRTYLKAVAYFENPPENQIVSTGFAVLRPKQNIHPKYLSWIIQSKPFIEKVVVHSVGVGYPAINPSELASLKVWFPPLPEQQAIAAYLDRQTAKIDALIAKKQRLLELLAEQRAALISQAVTKGLNPDVKMKDSGVAWLDQVPSHWEVTKVKRKSKRIQTGSTPPTGQEEYYQNEDIPWFGPGSFGDDLVLSNPTKVLSRKGLQDGVMRLFEAGSTMIVTIGATIGKVGYLEQDGSSNQQVTAITFNKENIIPKFGAYQLKRLEQAIRGIAPSTTLPIIDQQEVGYLPFVVPPKKEQVQIANYIDQQAKRLDALKTKVETVIERLREYRAALISSVVTGKVQVKDE
jgi:type I restriction enzyme S subunit